MKRSLGDVVVTVLSLLVIAAVVVAFVVCGKDAHAQIGHLEKPCRSSGAPWNPGAPPVPPSGLTATPGDSRVDLAWTDNAVGEMVQRIHRCSGMGCNPGNSVLAVIAADLTSYADTTVISGTTYSYAVYAVNSAGTSAPSNIVTATPTGPGSYVWAHDFGGTAALDACKVYSVATDSLGNVFAAGAFSGVVDFGGTVLTASTTSFDIFIAKFTPAGALSWAKRIGGASTDEAYGIAIDTSNNIVIGGQFGGSVDFGSGTPSVSAGFSDGFIAGYSGSTGAFAWSKTFGSTNIDYCYSVATDSANNVLATGYFQGTVDFGGGGLVSAGGKDIFVAKYSSTGTYSWSKKLGGANTDMAEDIAVDSSNNVILIGTFNGVVDFGGGSLTSGADDIVLAKYNSAGTYVWAFNFGDSTSEQVHSVAATTAGDIFISGEFIGVLNFGTGAMTNVATSDAYLAKFNSSGINQWSKQFGTTTAYGIAGKSVAVDSSGDVVLSGSIAGNVDMGGGLLSGNSRDSYLAKYDGNGTYQWARRNVGPSDEDGYGVTTAPGGFVVISGTLYDSVDFGSGTPLNSPFPSGLDGFVAKYAP